MMIKKELKMTTITDYAHQYLSGYNDTPIGVLDSAEFRAEVRRLAGPATPRSAGALKQVAKNIKALERYLAGLRGPRGGLPKTGLAEYRYNERVLEALKRELQ
jgi:hypothetical protein